MPELAVAAPVAGNSSASTSIRSSKSFKQRVSRSLRGGKSSAAEAAKEKADALERELRQVDAARANLEQENAGLRDRIQQTETLQHSLRELSDKLAQRALDAAAQDATRTRANVDALIASQARLQAALAVVVLCWAAALHLAPVWGPIASALVVVAGSGIAYLQYSGARVEPPKARQQIAKAVAHWRAETNRLVAEHDAQSSSSSSVSSAETDGGERDGAASSTARLANGVVFDRTRDKAYVEAKERFIQTLVDSLNPKELEALEEMRRIFADATCIELEEDIGTFRLNDQTFLRFLRARDYNVNKASAMLKNHLEWRDKVVPAKILPSDIQGPLRSGMARRSGITYDREPIVMVQIGLFDPADFDSVSHFAQYVAYFFEINLSLVDPDVEKGVIFIDMEGYSPRKHMSAKARKIIFAFINIVQDQNPETLKKLVLFNVPAIFRMAWNVIKGAIDPVVRDKILFATNLEVVREDVPPHLLNVRYGGDKEDEWAIDGLDKLSDDGQQEDPGMT